MLKRIFDLLERMKTSEEFHGLRALIVIILLVMGFQYFAEDKFRWDTIFLYAASIWMGYVVVFACSWGWKNAKATKENTCNIRSEISKFIDDYNHNLDQDAVYKMALVPDEKNSRYELTIDPDPYKVSIMAETYLSILYKFQHVEKSKMIDTLLKIQQNAERVHSINQSKKIVVEL
ncbi:hypothetical protein [Ammoniphilus sp. 3BR4]|uniref:hypothetical protein n=1 Tax=Ammoniphilus sp. 3BR4 TaxID=3158265 RepID=UPI0034679557